jgi:hypothetical protein
VDYTSDARGDQVQVRVREPVMADDLLIPSGLEGKAVMGVVGGEWDKNGIGGRGPTPPRPHGGADDGAE